MADHPGPLEAAPECKLRVGHPGGFAIILKVKRRRHLGGLQTRAMTTCDEVYASSRFGLPVARSSDSSPVYASSSGPNSSDGLGTSKPDGGMASRKPAALSSS